MTTHLVPPRRDGREELLAWLPEGVAALAVLLAMVVSSRYRLEDSSLAFPALSVAVGTAGAVLLARRLPSVALVLVWVVFLVQLVTVSPLLAPQIAIGYVAFACTRWGSTGTIVSSGLSMPLAAVLVGVLGFLDIDSATSLVAPVLGLAPTRSTYGLLVSAALVAAVVLVVPWVGGLAARATARAQVSQASQQVAERDAVVAHRDADQAREIATLRDEQARLARDVHDVVGHSLAVILAQAESAQYLPDDPARLKETLATIVTSARGSLTAVRDVLDKAAAPSASDPFGALVEGVRASGREVLVEDLGQARPLPPELAVVAERVLQEMLTNAVKHGTREQPIRVERHWPQGAYERDLRVEVSNAVVAAGVSDDTAPIVAPVSSGRGLEGMARRLEAVGGRLDVRRRQQDHEQDRAATFTATAWIPVRAA